MQSAVVTTDWNPGKICEYNVSRLWLKNIRIELTTSDMRASLRISTKSLKTPRNLEGACRKSRCYV